MNELVNCNCIDYMATMQNDSVDLILTDIPYGGVNRETNGLRELDKGDADIMTFDLPTFISECYRVSKGTIIIFCGQGQLSEIFTYYEQKQGTTRQLIWNKTNPSPMNGEHIYLSGIENAVWFRKPNATFNAFCKNTVFSYPAGTSEMHPTEKNHQLLQELITDNSNYGDIVFDPCAGSGSTLLVAYKLGRIFLGCELKSKYYKPAKERLEIEQSQTRLF